MNAPPLPPPDSSAPARRVTAARHALVRVAASARQSDGAAGRAWAAAAAAALAERIAGAAAARNCIVGQGDTARAFTFWRSGCIAAGDATAAAGIAACTAACGAHETAGAWVHPDLDPRTAACVARALGQGLARWEWRRSRLAEAAAGNAAAAEDLARRARRTLRRATGQVFTAAAAAPHLWPAVLAANRQTLRGAVTLLGAFGWPPN